MVSLEDSSAHFIVEDSSGIPLIDSTQALATTTPEKASVSHLPVFARIYTTGTAGVAPTTKISSFQVWSCGTMNNKPWSHQLAGTGRTSIINPTTFAQTSQMNYNSDPSNVVLSSSYYTTVAYAALGGEYILTVPSTVTTPNIMGIFSFSPSSSYSLYVTIYSCRRRLFLLQWAPLHQHMLNLE